MINIIEKYTSQIKGNKIIIKERAAESGAIVIYYTILFGFYEGTSSECNKLKKLFEKENKLNKLVNSFNFLNSLQSISLKQKRILDFISISIFRLFKNEKPPPSYNIIVSYINKLRSSPHPTSGFDFPQAAQISWEAIIKV
jgi:hypothetical protein